MNFSSTNVLDPALRKDLERDLKSGLGGTDGMTVVRPVFKAKHKWFEWELILKQDVAIIHIFPCNGGLKDEPFLMKMKDSVREVVIRYVSNMAFLAEWIDEVDSFCVSFIKTPDSQYINEKMFEEFKTDFKRRVVG